MNGGSGLIALFVIFFVIMPIAILSVFVLIGKMMVGSITKTIKLMGASRKGRLEYVKYFFSETKWKSVHLSMSLWPAALSGHLNVVKFLISIGADVNDNIILPHMKTGKHLYQVTAMRGRWDVLLYLLIICDEQKTQAWRQALMMIKDETVLKEIAMNAQSPSIREAAQDRLP